MNWKVPYVDLGAQYQAFKPEIDEAMQRVMASGRYVNGEETERFENLMEIYLGVRHVVAVGNGYDALWMAIKVMGGKSAFCDKYTHISTFAAIHNAGAEVKEVSEIYIPVHMNGRISDGCSPASFYPIIEDACQAIGAKYKGKMAGTIGIMGCFSLHPMKVLGCAGDGGFIATNRADLNNQLRYLRNHGGEAGYGVNSRLDNIQAAILNVKFPHLGDWIARRREIAFIYEQELPVWVKKPPAPSDGPYFDTYSSYVIGGSPELLDHLRDKGIECFSHIRDDVVSLPIYPEMKDGHIAMVIAAVKSYTNG